MTQINFAVIGVGSFGLKRAQAIKENKMANLKAICDINKKNLQKAKDVLKVPSLEFKECLKNDDIDVICICIPNKFHKQAIIDSLEAGKNVFCEKPLARNILEAQEISKIVQKTKKKLQIGSNHRFFESVMFAKKLLDSGELGKVLSFNGRIGHDGERIKEGWFMNRDLSGGGTLLDNGCHLLDLARYFVGDFNSGSGMVSNNYWKNIDVEDTAYGLFKNSKGQSCSIFCSWRLHSGYLFIELNCKNGFIVIDGRFNTFETDKIFWSLNSGELEIKDFSDIKPNSYKLEIENFIKNLKQNKKLSPDIIDGLEVMKMIDLVYKKQ